MLDNWANGVYANVNDAWENLYVGLNREGSLIHPRGKAVKETLGCDIYITNPMDNIVYNTYRGLSPIYMAREYLWYKSGSRDPKDAPNSKFWESIANDDGKINSNYGAYIFLQHDSKYKDLTVFDATLKLLREDHDTRQAIIQIPIMPHRAFKDTPCTSSIQFFIRENKLDAIVYMRSCDVCAGLTYDLFQFTMWQIEIANKLGIDLGFLRFCAGSLHLYEEDFIENRGDFYTVAKPYKEPTDKMSKEFLKDLAYLADNGGKSKACDLNSEELKFLLEYRKVWKRKDW